MNSDETTAALECSRGNPGATHWYGCACHEAAWAKRLAAAEERARGMRRVLETFAGRVHVTSGETQTVICSAHGTPLRCCPEDCYVALSRAALAYPASASSAPAMRRCEVRK